MTEQAQKAATEMLQEFVASRPHPTYEDCWTASRAIVEAAEMADREEMGKAHDKQSND